MWSTVWANKVGCTIIGSEPDNAHDGGSPWNGLSLQGMTILCTCRDITVSHSTLRQGV